MQSYVRVLQSLSWGEDGLIDSRRCHTNYELEAIILGDQAHLGFLAPSREDACLIRYLGGPHAKSPSSTIAAKLSRSCRRHKSLAHVISVGFDVPSALHDTRSHLALTGLVLHLYSVSRNCIKRVVTFNSMQRHKAVLEVCPTGYTLCFQWL